MDGYLYILRSKKNSSYYIGSTNDPERRKWEHFIGKSKYTKNILPVELVFIQKFPKITIARKVENWLKKQKDKNLLAKIIKEGTIKKIFT